MTADAIDMLNARLDRMDGRLERHAETGAAINAALSQVNATLAESGRGTVAGGVDVRPLGDKLAAQWRKLEMDGNGVFSVASIPQPEPEPE